jgi:hypothetical protein
MYATAFSWDDATRIAIESDPVVEKAIESLPKARALIESAKKLIVQRVAK